MKTEEVREIVISALKKQPIVTAQEINYTSKVPFVQIYVVMASLIKNGSVQLNISNDSKKSYSLVDENKLSDVVVPADKAKPAKINKVIEEDDETEEKPIKKAGRDLTTYKFNGTEYNKGRLAHAIIAHYAEQEKPTLKLALEIFLDEIVKPYGIIKPIKQAKEMSKERQRFFIKPEEEIKLRDCNIAVTNQWTPERINSIIAIGKKLGYKIK
jgi:hypothetical protein